MKRLYQSIRTVACIMVATLLLIGCDAEKSTAKKLVKDFLKENLVNNDFNFLHLIPRSISQTQSSRSCVPKLHKTRLSRKIFNSLKVRRRRNCITSVSSTDSTMTLVFRRSILTTS